MSDDAEGGDGLEPDATVAHGSAELLYLVHELSRLVSTHFDQAMAQYEITHSQWWALMHITLHEGKSQTELARIMQMGRAAVGTLLARLEAKGWIERRPDPDDHRVVRVYFLPAAVAAREAMRIAGRRHLGLFLEGMEEDEIALLLAGLKRIRANAERAITLDAAR